jgi:chorismate-pyruvate lyase
MNNIKIEVTKKLNYRTSLNDRNLIGKEILKKTKVDKRQVIGLSDFQKVLLITDGTVTELLEHHLDEGIKIEKVYEEIENNNNNIPEAHSLLVDGSVSMVLLRKVILKGKESMKNHLYAESSILVNNLPKKFKDDLIDSHMPIGKLWSKYRFETYKSDFVVGKEKADKELAICLNVPVSTNILNRTYCVYSKGKRVMIITEKFSANSFVN